MQKTVDIIEQMMRVALEVEKEPVEITDKESAEAALFFGLISNAQVVKEVSKMIYPTELVIEKLNAASAIKASITSIMLFVKNNYKGGIKINKYKWIDAAIKMAEAMMLFEEAIEVEECS